MGSMGSMQCNVEFGYQLSICSGTKEFFLELFLRPTVSRPVRLGIGPPFGTLDLLSCSSFV
jgi:hypothetical protein